MVRSNKAALVLAALVTLTPTFAIGLEARTHVAAQAQKIAAQSPVRTPKEF